MPLREILLQMKKLFANLSLAKKMTLITLTAGTLAGFILLLTWSGQQEMHPLYTGLDAENAGGIITYLKEQKIPYQLSANGTAVMIPADRIHETRMALASLGLPQGNGVGFEVFDDTKLGMTEFVQNVNYQRALQGELARSIRAVAEVDSARVHLVMPQRSLFVENEEPASASVVLKLQRGKWLNQSQIQGVVHLVSSSVPRLKPEHVTIVDSTGKLLAGQSGDSPTAKLSSHDLEYQEKLERGLENRVKTMLDKALGQDNTVVRLTCNLDFRRQEMTEEMYLPANRVVRSEQRSKEVSKDDNQSPMGVPGVRSNVAPRPGRATQNESSSYEKQDRTVNYEIGKRTSHIIEPVAQVKQVSVAVVVDGTYQRIEKNAKQYEWQYVPRTTEEMQKIENIVKGAVNFSAERGDKVEVVNIPFETEKLAGTVQKQPEPGWLDRLGEHSAALKYILFGIFLLFSFLFVVRPLTKWLTANTLGELEMVHQLPKTVGEIEREYGGATMPNTEELNRLLTTHQDAGVNVMRQWMTEK